MKVTLAKSAGFCFGVKRAVDTVYEQLEKSISKNQPIYTFGPIIHNEEVVHDLEEKGVTVLESVEELEERAPQGGTVIIRAHGVEKGISGKIKELGYADKLLLSILCLMGGKSSKKEFQKIFC